MRPHCCSRHVRAYRRRKFDDKVAVLNSFNVMLSASFCVTPNNIMTTIHHGCSSFRKEPINKSTHVSIPSKTLQFIVQQQDIVLVQSNFLLENFHFNSQLNSALYCLYVLAEYVVVRSVNMLFCMKI